MSLEEFIYSYFASGSTIGTMVAIYGVIAVLLLSFKLKKDSTVRSRLLMLIFGASVFGWGFIATSLIICSRLAYLYEIVGDSAVGLVLGYALGATVVIAIPVTFVVSRNLPNFLSRNLDDAEVANEEISGRIQPYARMVGLSGPVRLVQSASKAAFAYTAGNGDLIVISNGLVDLLDKDELEAVLVHELAHAKSSDTRLKVLLHVYRKFLFFDPVLRFVESSLYRERELVADEFSARVTEKPLSLASALLKLAASRDVGARALLVKAPFPSRSDLVRTPKTRERVLRLVKLADEIPARGPNPSSFEEHIIAA